MQLQRSSGVLLHPTSLPGDYGIGDLGRNAYEWVDFLERTKQCMWQVLPLGPTSFGDSPYQSFSTFAGNYLLISPEILIEKDWLVEEDLYPIPEFDPHKIDYASVIEYKNKLLRQAYQNFTKSKSAKASFTKFCKANKHWLDDYAMFTAFKFHFISERKNTFESPEYLEYKAANEELLPENSIKDYFYGAVWNTWPKELMNRDKDAIREWSKKLEDEISYLKFLQYEFFAQWSKLKTYANKRNVKIIGDIPVFVAMDSADVWANKDLFYLDSNGYPTVVAGVPPDYFSETGQLWGNPIYDWPKHKEADFAWWINRVAGSLALVDIVRIDHFRGFDSYWAIPYGEETAVNGKWVKGPGRALFTAIEKALGDLPIIAEDLGIITDSVTKLRISAKLPGMKVLQFAFGQAGEDEYLPHNYTDSNFVVYTGTHDNDTSIGWYNTASEQEKDYYRRYMNVDGTDIAWDLIRLAFSSNAKCAIVPIQDIMKLGTEFRMNTPGKPTGNWQFRYTKDMLEPWMEDKWLYLTELFNRQAEKLKK